MRTGARRAPRSRRARRPPRADDDTRVLAPHVLAPHVVARLREQWRGAAAVDTTIDAGLQRAVEDIVRDEVGQGPHRARGLEHAAVIVLDNASGEVLAWVGSADFFDDATLGKNDGVRARRQPGSALKPFIYGRALEGGMTAATVLPDVDTALALDGADVFLPQNYDRRMHGPVTVRLALQNSYNVPAVRVARTLGADAVLDVLRDAGFTSLDKAAAHYGVGLVLGNGEVSLEELARAYRGLALGGVRKDHHLVTRVTSADGVVADVVDGGGARGERFVREDVVALLTDILVDGAARTPAFGADNALDLPFVVAAKTGTSHAWVDNWTAGFTAERTVAVWAGAFDGTPMRGVSGVSGAGAVFRRVMLAAMKGIAPARLVDERRFVHARVCPQSGLLAGASCPGFDEIFLPGTAPTTSCDVHGAVDGGVDGGRTPGATSTTSTTLSMSGDPDCAAGERALRLGGALDDWAARDGRCRAADVQRAATLLSPRDGDHFLLAPGVPLEGQEVALRTRGPVVAVVVDGAAHATTSTQWLSLDRGAHVVVVRFADGHEERARFTIE